MRPLNTTPLRLLGGLLLLAATAVFQTGCDDTTGLFAWSDQTDTLAIFSLARPEHLGEPSAFSLLTKTRKPVENVSREDCFGFSAEDEFCFDFALSESDAGFVLLPSGLFAELPEGAGLQAVETPYEELDRVPLDGYVTDEPIPIEEGMVFAVRSRRISGSFIYGRMHIISVGADGIVELELFRNPNRNDRNLVPTEDE